MPGPILFLVRHHRRVGGWWLSAERRPTYIRGRHAQGCPSAWFARFMITRGTHSNYCAQRHVLIQILYYSLKSSVVPGRPVVVGYKGSHRERLPRLIQSALAHSRSLLPPSLHRPTCTHSRPSSLSHSRSHRWRPPRPSRAPRLFRLAFSTFSSPAPRLRSSH